MSGQLHRVVALPGGDEGVVLGDDEQVIAAAAGNMADTGIIRTAEASRGMAADEFFVGQGLCRAIDGGDLKVFDAACLSASNHQAIDRLPERLVVDAQLIIAAVADVQIGRIDTGVEADGILATFVEQTIDLQAAAVGIDGSIAGIEDIGVVAQAAQHVVHAGAAGQGVVAVEAGDDVVTATAVDAVIHSGAKDRVVAFGAVEVEAAGQQAFPTQAAAVGELEAGETLRPQRIVGIEVLDVDRVAIAQVEEQRSFAQLDGILVKAFTEDEDALLGAGVVVQYLINAVALVEQVGVSAGAAVDDVIALAADNDVVAAHAPDVVDTVATGKVVVTRYCLRGIIAIEVIHSSPAQQDVVALLAHKGVIPLLAKHHVVAGAAPDVILALAGIDDVGAAARRIEEADDGSEQKCRARGDSPVERRGAGVVPVGAAFVVARGGFENVLRGVVGVAEDEVVAGAGDQQVLAGTAGQDVVVGTGDEDVVARIAGEPVAFLAAGGVVAAIGDGVGGTDSDVAVDHVVICIPGEYVAAAAAFDEVVAFVAIDVVAAGACFDPVVAAAATDVVV